MKENTILYSTRAEIAFWAVVHFLRRGLCLFGIHDRHNSPDAACWFCEFRSCYRLAP